MINVTKYLLVALLFVSSTIIAQDFQGVATYKSKRQLDLKLDSTQMGSEMADKMMQMLKKQFQKTHILTFSKTESIYKEEERLESPNPAGMEVLIVSSGGSDILYKNTKENRFVNQNESYSKVFLIKDELKKHDWKLSGETKFIGDYKCFKATKIIQRQVVKSRISINGDNEEKEDKNKEPEMKDVEVLAWYTPDIPVNNGPADYHGLPGLILEVNDGNTTTICSKIVLNPEKKITIKEPTKGKEISQEKYDVIMKKKSKEMRENTRSSRGRDGENLSLIHI